MLRDRDPLERMFIVGIGVVSLSVRKTFGTGLGVIHLPVVAAFFLFFFFLSFLLFDSFFFVFDFLFLFFFISFSSVFSTKKQKIESYADAYFVYTRDGIPYEYHSPTCYLCT